MTKGEVSGESERGMIEASAVDDKFASLERNLPPGEVEEGACQLRLGMRKAWREQGDFECPSRSIGEGFGDLGLGEGCGFECTGGELHVEARAEKSGDFGFDVAFEIFAVGEADLVGLAEGFPEEGQVGGIGGPGLGGFCGGLALREV